MDLVCSLTRPSPPISFHLSFFSFAFALMVSFSDPSLYPFASLLSTYTHFRKVDPFLRTWVAEPISFSEDITLCLAASVVRR